MFEFKHDVLQLAFHMSTYGPEARLLPRRVNPIGESQGHTRCSHWALSA